MCVVSGCVLRPLSIVTIVVVHDGQITESLPPPQYPPTPHPHAPPHTITTHRHAPPHIRHTTTTHRHAQPPHTPLHTTTHLSVFCALPLRASPQPSLRPSHHHHIHLPLPIHSTHHHHRKGYFRCAFGARFVIGRWSARVDVAKNFAVCLACFSSTWVRTNRSRNYLSALSEF